jgi:hypothetical protein
MAVILGKGMIDSRGIRRWFGIGKGYEGPFGGIFTLCISVALVSRRYRGKSRI